MKKAILLIISLFALTKLNAQQTIQASLDIKSNGVNSTQIVLYKQDNLQYNNIFSNNAGFGVYNSNSAKTTFLINDMDNVGIGTTNPLNKLDVNGGINASLYYLKNSGTIDYPGSYLHRLRAEDGNLFIDGDTGGSTYSPALTVHRGGNIGIGTTSPREKLSVRGNIRAIEIKVEADNWPDYVFKKEYKLPSLAETEKYILDNGHLPEIPTAAEIDKDGLALGEMNKKLLKKIEELTLHLIEMEKLNKHQKMESDKMEKRLRKLESSQK